MDEDPRAAGISEQRRLPLNYLVTQCGVTLADHHCRSAILPSTSTASEIEVSGSHPSLATHNDDPNLPHPPYANILPVAEPKSRQV